MRMRIKSMLGSMLRRNDGATAVIFALLAPALLGVVGVAIDFARYNHTRANLQGLADGAAIAAVQSMAVANMAESSTAASVQSYVNSHAENMAWQKGQNGIVVTATVDLQANSVEVQLSEVWQPMLAHFLTGDVKTPVVVSSTASMVGGTKICVLALDPGASGALSLTGDARVEANGCGAYSNSLSATGLSSYKNSLLTAVDIFSAGGYGGNSSNFYPTPTQDSPPVGDPLKDRPTPEVGACDYTNFSVNSEVRTLSPGVYCGGLLISGSSTVTLQEGVYVIKDGSLQVTHTASLSGEHAGFFLTGANAKFLFAGGSSISLSAPKSGPMAGLLFYEDRSNPAGQIHQIVSDNARELVGTIYLPKGNFLVSSLKPVADQSAYTAIIANTIQLHKFPRLVLNTNYDQTDVPVPPGLIGGRVVLTN